MSGRLATTSNRPIGVNAGSPTAGNTAMVNMSWSKATGAKLQFGNKKSGAHAPPFVLHIASVHRQIGLLGLKDSVSFRHETQVESTSSEYCASFVA